MLSVQLEHVARFINIMCILFAIAVQFRILVSDVLKKNHHAKLSDNSIFACKQITIVWTSKSYLYLGLQYVVSR